MLDIDATKTDWTKKELNVSMVVFEKILRCVKAGKLPRELFELFCRCKVNVSTELIMFDDQGRVFLVQRPDDSRDPYANEWHAPGVTWNQGEDLEATFARLRSAEGVSFAVPVRRVVETYQCRKRGTYVAFICVALATKAPTNPRGRFFSVDEIPWDKLIETHRETVLPAGLHAASLRQQAVVKSGACMSDAEEERGGGED